jgi:hypothetical protein
MMGHENFYLKNYLIKRVFEAANEEKVLSSISKFQEFI